MRKSANNQSSEYVCNSAWKRLTECKPGSQKEGIRWRGSERGQYKRRECTSLCLLVHYNWSTAMLHWTGLTVAGDILVACTRLEGPSGSTEDDELLAPESRGGWLEFTR